MSQVTACRACLVENLTLYRVTNSPYEEIYEKLTNAKLGKVYPDTFCYICMSVLRKFRNFATLAQHSNIKLKQWYKSEIDRKPTTQPLFTISTTTVEYVSMAHDENEDKALTIKIENTDDTAEDQTNEMQYIESTRESEIYSQPADTTNMDATNAMGSDSWSDAEQKPGPASDEEFEVPIVKQEPRKRAVKVEKTPKGTGTKQSRLRNLKKNKTQRNKENDSEYHPCDFCNYMSPRWNRLKKHIKNKHPDIIELTCFCNYAAASQTDLLLHKIKRHFVEKHFICDVCGFVTSKSKINLIRHMRIHSRPQNLEQNEKKTIAVKKTKKKKKETDPEYHPCDFCNYKTQRRNRLKKHMKNKHPDIKKLNCFCNYAAASQTDLLLHKIKRHFVEKEFICDICRYATSTSKTNLARHMRIHRPKTIKCHLCDYKCAIKKNLKNHHIMTHTKEKHFMCHICDYRCSLVSRLYTHLQTHKEKRERKLKCEYCGKRFTRREHLKRHVRIHTGEKPYACPVCGQRFNQDGAMKLHSKRHNKSAK